MGSSGGMCGIALRDPKRYDRAYALLATFRFLDDYGWHSDAKEANETWWDESAGSGHRAPQWLVGTYGTGQDFDYCETLRDVLLAAPAEGELCIDPTLTFAELAEDIATRPLCDFYGRGGWRYPETDRLYVRGGIGYMRDARGRTLTELEMMTWEATGSCGGEEWRRACLGAGVPGGAG